MPQKRFTVLLVGKTTRTAGQLLGYLRRHGCLVRSAVSFEEAAGLLRKQRFDLVLSDFLISGGTAYRLIPLLNGTKTSMFISDAVGDGCWWMNAIYEGKDRTKEPGLHPSEFKVRLDHLLIDKRRGATDQKFMAQGQMLSKITRNPTFVRQVLVVLIACLAAFGILLFGFFAHTQPRLTRSINAQNAPCYSPKSVQRLTAGHVTKLRFYEKERE